ncbi:MAG: hypothetical protein IPG00_09625 [Saprospiraceae bacterium]|nr:hypothetical protein [Saprospiraceae bacterium]
MGLKPKCWGISGGYGITDWATIHTRFMIGRLSGDDAFADDISRKERNLSLFTYFTNMAFIQISL